MSHATTFLHDHAPQARRALGILVITMAVIASLLTVTMSSMSPDAAEEQHTSAAPAVPAMTAGWPEPGVPEASTVFKGRDMPVEDLAPTF